MDFIVFSKEFPNINFLFIILLSFISTIIFDLYPNFYGVLLIIISSKKGYRNVKGIELVCMFLYSIFIDQRLLMLYVFIISLIKYKTEIKIILKSIEL